MRDGRDAAGGEAVIEWAPFRLAAGVSEAELLEAAEMLQRDFVDGQPGFVRRELLRASDGEWVDLVVWEDEASARAVMEAACASEAFRSLARLLEGVDPADPEAGVRHLRRVRLYERAAAPR